MTIGIIVLLGACYVVYLIASAKTRREKTVEGAVRAMAAHGTREAHFSRLYFDAAKGYAADKGSPSREADVASVDVLIDGRRWFVTFWRDPGMSGTRITIEDAQKIEREVEDFARDASDDGRAGNRGAADVFVEAWIAEYDASSDEQEKELLALPTWVRKQDLVADFVDDVTERCVQAGIPELYAMASFYQKDGRKLMFGCVAAAERIGHELSFQRAVATAMMKRLWNQMDAGKQQQRARQATASGMTADRLKAALKAREDSDA